MSKLQEQEIVSLLKTLLAGEISAVETYIKLGERLKISEIKQEIGELRTAHARRARLLRRALRRLGGQGSGPGSPMFHFPAVCQGVYSDNMALALLSKGECEALEAYSCALDAFNDASEDIGQELFDDQELTHNVVSTLASDLERLSRIA
jgi:hypothetical protein